MERDPFAVGSKHVFEGIEWTVEDPARYPGYEASIHLHWTDGIHHTVVPVRPSQLGSASLGLYLAAYLRQQWPALFPTTPPDAN